MSAVCAAVWTGKTLLRVQQQPLWQDCSTLGLLWRRQFSVSVVPRESLAASSLGRLFHSGTALGKTVLSVLCLVGGQIIRVGVGVRVAFQWQSDEGRCLESMLGI